MTEKNIENLDQQVEEKPQLHIKKHLERPPSRRGRRKRNKLIKKYEKAYNKRQYREEGQKNFKLKLMVGLLLILGVIVGLKYFMTFQMPVMLESFLKPSVGVSIALILLALIWTLLDKTNGPSNADPITDFFILSRGKINGPTRSSHLTKINTRFMMVTLLKLYRKDQIAIMDGRIIVGSLDGDLSKDEKVLLNFILDHNINTVEELIEALRPENRNGVVIRKDEIYRKYKDAVLEMADDRYYINHTVAKAKWLLKIGAIFDGLLVLLLISNGQGTMEMLGVFSLQAVALYVISVNLYAHSRAAHKRLGQIRKEKKLLQSDKANLYITFIYNYLYGKEARSIKRIQKMYESGQMSRYEYSKFAESYNGFNYIVDFIRKEN
ncbi:DUF2207 domain-containing protein [Acidaminobacter sp. JC074]|uniref:hypothetical protein n=1 Tax=Acidaminobacter sp. JC074 TaxID=2530199 RepID=UPI001F0D13D1|nr:hypothetical protein [Acidaminobacter sp. JC074]MCH4887977.1 DUF2207 domain-containing protein [Acidaminobacter sp. JC074]